MDYKSYRESHRNNQKSKGNNEYIDIDFSNMNNSQNANDVKKMLDKYSHLDENDILKVLFEEVNREKSEGSFDLSKLKNFYRQISPYLGNNERVKMRGIIEALDNK